MRCFGPSFNKQWRVNRSCFGSEPQTRVVWQCLKRVLRWPEDTFQPTEHNIALETSMCHCYTARDFVARDCSQLFVRKRCGELSGRDKWSHPTIPKVKLCCFSEPTTHFALTFATPVSANVSRRRKIQSSNAKPTSNRLPVGQISILIR